ncbi:MAG: hypothetical protein ACLRSW_05765 [Christensenellaceae bacterium]
MAVVVDEKDAEAFILWPPRKISPPRPSRHPDTGRMKMLFKGRPIVDISREFLNTNGVKQTADAEIGDKVTRWFDEKEADFAERTKEVLSDLNVCAKKGLSETFDSTIGARTVYMPWGGKNQLTPAIAMAAKICGGETDVCTVSACGCHISIKQPVYRGVYSIVASVPRSLRRAPIIGYPSDLAEF